MINFKKQPKLNCFIEKYAKDYPLLLKFAETEQDKLWHAEGSVDVHTDMVLAELYGMIVSGHPDVIALTESDLQTLMFACAFHDYAKPITTKTDIRNDRECIVSPNHELVAASLLINSKVPDELTWDQWVTVCKLIAYHQMPKKAVKNNFTYGQYVRLLHNASDLRLLYILELADMKGRTCNDHDDNLTFLELFKSECVDNSVFTSLDSYKKSLSSDISDYSDAVYHIAHTDLYDSRIHALDVATSMPYSFAPPPTLVVMCGLAGSGKSTHIHSRFSNYEVISLDAIREELYGDMSIQGDPNEVKRVAIEKMRVLFRQKKNVVYDATNYRIDFRTKVTSLAKNYGYYTKIFMISNHVEACVQNTASRDRDVPRYVIEDQFNSFQFPSLAESHCVEFEQGYSS